MTNRFLYKYMPLRPAFFDEPMIRATPVLALNDPFEGWFNRDQVRDADYNHRKYYIGQGKDVCEADGPMVDDLVGVVQNNLYDLGVISFTEDCNNPLMWAHYADEHRGFVVEFDFDQPFFMDSFKDLNGRSSRFGKSYFVEIFEFPRKVDYRREMPDFSRAELSAPDSINEFRWAKFNRTILFTKSNDWIYEKEQRSVVYLKDADSVICADNLHVRKCCKKDPVINVFELEGGKIQVVFPPGYEMHEEKGDESIKQEIFRISGMPESVIHLFRINPEAVSGVYFGCRSNYCDALKRIENNKLFHRLGRCFVMKKSGQFYELDRFDLRN